MQFQISQFNKVKLIIWDLDETLWNGTLSEGDVDLPESHKELLMLSTEIGIINSICSKNEDLTTKEKLSELGVLNYFVFPSINWEPKGSRIKHTIEVMQLRASNVLFIDDNHLNIAEAEFFCPEIMTSKPDVIGDLLLITRKQFYSGKRNNRIQQYRILEQKQAEMKGFESNEAFLSSCRIRVIINEDCSDMAERIFELNKRANQLNFTKNRVELEEIYHVINDANYRCGAVKVFDRFGDYGIVGFYCVNTLSNRLEHFFFSCRTMGMGVEQYVYNLLGCPHITIVGETSSDLNNPDNPFWINKNDSTSRDSFSTKKRILFKGPCDLWSICNFFDDDAIVTEFTYDMEKNGAIDFGLNHTVTMINATNYSSEIKKSLERNLPFIGEKTYNTQLFSGKCQVVVLSVLIDAMLACYRRRSDGVVVAWGDWCLDITNPDNWADLISGKLETYGLQFELPFLKQFSSEWIYEGQISIEETVNNIMLIRRSLPADTVLLLILGSEIAYHNNTLPAYDGREKYNIELNHKLKEAVEGIQNTHIINTTDFIFSQNDFNDRITHLTKQVYYRMACAINQILVKSNFRIHQKRKVYAMFASVRQKLWRSSLIRKVYLRLTTIRH